MLSLIRGLRRVPNLHTSDTLKRYIHYTSLGVDVDSENLPSYTVSKDPKEWEFVQRLLPQTQVPAPPTENKKYFSGWKPQTVKVGEYPYYIERSRNHMLPVYLRVSQRGMKRHTVVRHIHGDIYALAEELKDYLQPKLFKQLGMKVSEVSAEIRIMGDFVNDIKMWLEERNF